MYASSHQFEPLLRSIHTEELYARAATIVQSALSLTSAAHPTARAMIRELVRSMNSYYSNRIEGQGTHPLNIEKALRDDFSQRPDVAKLQRIALAHIDAERELEARVTTCESVLTSKFLIEVHTALYSRLSDTDRTTEDGYIVEPGALRKETVEVGLHIPPVAASLPKFLSRLDEVYGRVTSWDNRLIAIACLHHRAAWVHPFRDGNGRATRLQSHCALWPLSAGLWSPSRGLARARQDYYAHLHNADAPRRGDLDGRGNLTAAGLSEWIRFFLEVCEDQVNYMSRMLELDGMKRRIEALVTFRSAEDKNIRPQAILPLYHVFAAGPITRGEFTQMTGLGERTARTLLSRLLATRLLVSDTPHGPVRFGLPLDALRFLFPELYPEVDIRLD
ncbi:Fic family protein [Noviherbaspirillum saxi]|uniref:Fic family protein n=1 Tax=Noviherbaspirillum saxi TaxID=2320863 RepID=A0A3A3FTC9_9BURK|nr:Fic family protein [Noviherbaspirillum saxi]